MGIAGTTSAEALTTIEGSVNAAKAAFDNFLNGSSSPKELADSVITAGKNIADNLMQIVPRLAEELPQVGSLLMDSLSESLNSGKLNELMSVGGEIVSNLTTGIISALPGLVNSHSSDHKFVCVEYRIEHPAASLIRNADPPGNNQRYDAVTPSMGRLPFSW